MVHDPARRRRAARRLRHGVPLVDRPVVERRRDLDTVLSLPCIQVDCTVRYTTLGPDSIAQGDGFVFLGTYSNASPATNTNYIYRSADNGVTWSVANTSTQFRHIHGLEFDPVKKRLYVLFGDSNGMATWYSADDGVTLKPLCTAYACTSIEAAIDPSGAFYVIGHRQPGPGEPDLQGGHD